jgi:hypothetical protein
MPFSSLHAIRCLVNERKERNSSIRSDDDDSGRQRESARMLGIQATFDDECQSTCKHGILSESISLLSSLSLSWVTSNEIQLAQDL